MRPGARDRRASIPASRAGAVAPAPRRLSAPEAPPAAPPTASSTAPRPAEPGQRRPRRGPSRRRRPPRRDGRRPRRVAALHGVSAASVPLPGAVSTETRGAVAAVEVARGRSRSALAADTVGRIPAASAMGASPCGASACATISPSVTGVAVLKRRRVGAPNGQRGVAEGRRVARVGAGGDGRRSGQTAPGDLGRPDVPATRLACAAWSTDYESVCWESL